MKTYKKIFMGLLLAVLTVLALVLAPAHKALAVTAFSSNPFGSKFNYQNGQITTLIAAGTNLQQTLTFTSSSSKPLVFTSTDKIFCTQTSPQPSSSAVINLTKAPSGAQFNGTLTAWYFSTAGGGCNSGANGSITITNQDRTSGGASGLPYTLTYGTDVYTIIDPSLPLYGLNSGNKGSGCYGGSVILTNAKATSGTAFVGLSGNGGPVPLQPSLVKAGASSAIINLISGCGFQDPSATTAGYSGAITNGLLNAPLPSSSNTTSSNTDSGSTSCESNFVSPFAWIVCPALSLADGAIGAAYGQVEGQLCFNTGTTSSTSGVVCKGPNTLVDGVKSAWNIFKNIASALLVIAMLVMVISQAIGGGPFDAYTVRKMLPKLVAAVIIMQLSWVFLKWAIDISNDAGSAIGSLMMAPFGGPDNMNLGKMIGNGVNVATGSTGGQIAFDLFGTIAGIGAFVYAIPALPLLALYVVTGVFVAFFVLVLRKLLIIMLVILAPIALVAWVLPGTERYWKLWTSNFTKLLTMFPLIMGMLAAGRIFAYITSQAGNSASLFKPQLGIAHLGSLPVPYVASATGFADLAIIIGAFFAPYFLLPKTFNWGGQLLGQAGKAVENITNKGTEAPKKFLKSREEGYRAERRRKSQERVAAGQDTFRTINPLKLGSTAVDKFRSGKWDPTLGRPKFMAGGSRRRQAAVDSYVQSGEETYQKDIEAARARVLREGQDVRAHGGQWDRYFQKVADGADSYYDSEYRNDDGTKGKEIKIGKRSEAEQDAARKQTAILGSQTNWRYLEDYYQRSTADISKMTPDERKKAMSPQERVRARKFFDDNVSTIMPKMPHFYQGYGAAADATGATLAGQHGVEVEAIISKFSKDIQDTTKTATERADAQRSLVTYLQNIQSAADNPNITLDNGALRAVKGFLDSTEGASFRGEINNPDNPDGREARKLPALKAYDDLALSPEAKAEIDRISASLAPRIDPVTGTLSYTTPEPEGGLNIPHQPTSGSTGWSAPPEYPPEPLPPHDNNPDNPPNNG